MQSVIDNFFFRFSILNFAASFIIGVKAGGPAGYNDFNGWLDCFRFSNGIARWTANFTPPIMAYPVVTGGTQAVWFFMKRTKQLWDSIGGIYRPRDLGVQI